MICNLIIIFITKLKNNLIQKICMVTGRGIESVRYSLKEYC